MKIMTKLYRNIVFSAFALTASIASAAEPAFINAYDPWLYETAPVAAEVDEANVQADPAPSALAEEVTIKAEGRRITISGAEDQTLEVFNIAGVKVATYSIDAPNKTINLTVSRGVYILRVGKVARKVNIL